MSLWFQSSIVYIAHADSAWNRIRRKTFAVRSYGYDTVIFRPVKPQAIFTPIHFAMSGKNFVSVLFLVLLLAEPIHS